jgi:hypothetical protein
MYITSVHPPQYALSLLHGGRVRDPPNTPVPCQATRNQSTPLLRIPLKSQVETPSPTSFNSNPPCEPFIAVLVTPRGTAPLIPLYVRPDHSPSPLSLSHSPSLPNYYIATPYSYTTYLTDLRITTKHVLYNA